MKKVTFLFIFLSFYIFIFSKVCHSMVSIIKDDPSNYTYNLLNKKFENDKKNIILIKLENNKYSLNLINEKYFYNPEKLEILDIYKIAKKIIKNKQIEGVLFFVNENTYFSTSSIYNLIETIKLLRAANKKVLIYATQYKSILFSISLYADESYIAAPGVIYITTPKPLNLFFFHDLLKKIGIKIFTTYKRNYKTAHEVLSRKDSSKYLKIQMNERLENIRKAWFDILDKRYRKTKLKSIHLSGLEKSFYFLYDIQKYDMADKIIPIQDFLDFFQKKYNLFKVTRRENKEILNNLSSDQNNIVALKLEGYISNNYSNMPPFIHYKSYLPILKEIRDNPKIKGVLLLMNSPGGKPFTINVIFNILKDISRKKPLVIFINDYCLSGCYFLSTSANSIVANPFSEVGGIGILNIRFSYKDLLKKLGINQEIISLTGEMPPHYNAQLDISKKSIKIDDITLENLYFIFKKHVSQNRKIDMQKMENISQGRVYAVANALKFNLIDKIGSIETAINILKEKANLMDKDINIINYPHTSLFLDSHKINLPNQKIFSSIIQSKEDMEYLKLAENKFFWLLPASIKYVIFSILGSFMEGSSSMSMKNGYISNLLYLS